MVDEAGRISLRPDDVVEIPDNLNWLEDKTQQIFKIVLIRSGGFSWDQRNIYCGWYDSKLSTAGQKEMTQASKLLKSDGFKFDVAYCSALERSKDSLNIILSELGLTDIEINSTWELNERHYGGLTVPITNDLERKIAEAFEVFDFAGNKRVDIREIGTIVRSLGCIPSEAELQEILVQTECTEASGTVHLSTFLPYMTKIFTEHRFQPATPAHLLEAFKTIDTENLGYVTRERMTTLLLEEGEPLTGEEIEEMMATACDPQTQTIPYEYYINQLMLDPPTDNDLYALADAIQAAKPKKSVRTASQILRAAQELQDEYGI